MTMKLIVVTMRTTISDCRSRAASVRRTGQGAAGASPMRSRAMRLSAGIDQSARLAHHSSGRMWAVVTRRLIALTLVQSYSQIAGASAMIVAKARRAYALLLAGSNAADALSSSASTTGLE